MENKLTKREQQVLDLILKGKKNKEICAELDLAAGTVKTHLHNIYKHYGVDTRLQLALKVIELGRQPKIVRRTVLGVNI